MHRVHNLFPDDCRHPALAIATLAQPPSEPRSYGEVSHRQQRVSILLTFTLFRNRAAGWRERERESGGETISIFDVLHCYRSAATMMERDIRFTPSNSRNGKSTASSFPTSHAPVDSVPNHRDLSLLLQRSLLFHSHDFLFVAYFSKLSFPNAMG